jgi:hypothetical protein
MHAEDIHAEDTRACRARARRKRDVCGTRAGRVRGAYGDIGSRCVEARLSPACNGRAGVSVGGGEGQRTMSKGRGWQ